MHKENSNTVLFEQCDGYAILTLNRPEVLNALNNELMNTLTAYTQQASQDDQIHSLIIRGSDKAFAAGADIDMMKDLRFPQTYLKNFVTANWDPIGQCRKPIIAAVSGFALGGGCELALTCDMIIASEEAQFGQPEITLGIMPGAGGTQRLARHVGKAKAMDICLTGRRVSAQEAEKIGMISRLVPRGEAFAEAEKMAQHLSTLPLTSILMIKESIMSAYETPLTQGLQVERRLFHACFGLEAQQEAMHAFMEKRKPNFKRN